MNLARINTIFKRFGAIKRMAFDFLDEKQQLEQHPKRVGNDGNKRKAVEKQLAEVESELSTKDTDSYRKQHATYTYH